MPKRLYEDVDNAVELRPEDEGTQNGISAPSPAKFVHVDDDNSDLSVARDVVMECDLPPHRSCVQFTSYHDYEQHHQRVHVHVCSECSRVFPSNHYLELHISEHHDPIVEARRARGDKTYGCFVEDCDRLCSTPQKRRLHVIDKHHFPKDYNFWVVKSGTNGRFKPGKEMYSRTAATRANTFAINKDNASNRRRSSTTTTTTNHTDQAENDVTTSMQLVPNTGSIQDGKEGSIKETVRMPQATGQLEHKTGTSSNVDTLTESMDRMKVAQSSHKVKFGKGQRSGFLR